MLHYPWSILLLVGMILLLILSAEARWGSLRRTLAAFFWLSLRSLTDFVVLGAEYPEDQRWYRWVMGGTWFQLQWPGRPTVWINKDPRYLGKMPERVIGPIERYPRRPTDD